MGHVASHHLACLSLEIIQINVENYIAIDVLKFIGWLLALGNSLECNLCLVHLFLYTISPESVSMLLVNSISLIDHLWQLKPKFICLLRY